MPSNLISVGRLIDESWELYKTRFHDLMNMSAWLLLLAIFYAISLSLYPSASTLWLSNELSWSETLGVIFFFITNYIIAPLLGVWVLIGLVRLVRVHISGRAGNISKAMQEIRPLFFPTIIVSVMVTFLLVVASIIAFGPPLLIAGLGFLLKSSALIILGNILVIIGTFVALGLTFKWMVEYILAPYATMVDGVTGRKALVSIQKLVKGNFWATFIRLAIPKLVFVLCGVIIMGIISYATTILLSAASGLNMDLQLRLTTLVEWTLPVIIAVLINPLMIIADLLLYKSLKGDL